MSVGNLQGIKAWLEDNFHEKSEINDFFIQSSLYDAYQLTIIDTPGLEVTLTGGTSGRVETVEIPDSGSVTKLLFFTSGETLTVDDTEITITKTLSNNTDTIDLEALKVPSITRVFNNTARGGNTYTIQEDGIYLILTSGGSMDASPYQISLPSGKTPLFAESGLVSDNYKPYSFVIADLSAGDVVTLTGDYNSSYTAMQKTIYKLSNLGINSNSVKLTLIKGNNVSAGIQYSCPNDSNHYLVFGYAGCASGRATTIEDQSSGGNPEAYISENVGIQTVTGIYYGTGTNMPTVKFKGYNYNYSYGSAIIYALKVEADPT